MNRILKIASIFIIVALISVIFVSTSHTETSKTTSRTPPKQASTSSSSSMPPPKTVATQSNKDYASQVASQLLNYFIPPQSFALESSLPAAIATLATPTMTFSKDVVYLSKFYLTNSSYETTYTYLENNLPLNNPFKSGSGSSGKYGQVQSEFVEFTYPNLNSGISEETLMESVIPYNNATYVSITAEVIYFPNRPTWSILSNNVTKIIFNITDSNNNQSQTTLNASESSQSALEIQNIVSIFNSLKPALISENPGGPALTTQIMNQRIYLTFFSNSKELMKIGYNIAGEVEEVGGIYIIDDPQSNLGQIKSDSIAFVDANLLLLNQISAATGVKIIT